jgi:aldehyde:ferredoxin oxidoreductase
VLGSKKVKAVVIKTTRLNLVEYHDRAMFQQEAASWTKATYKRTRQFSKFGTNIGFEYASEVYGMPVKNFSLGRCPFTDQMDAAALNRRLSERGGRCGVSCSPGCAIQCSNLYVDENQQPITSGLEYETIAMNGPNLMISDFDVVARIDHGCDDNGVDTIEFGAAVGVLMEGEVIAWGDGDAVLRILDGIATGDELSLAVANGCRTVGEKYGVARVPQVKGQSLPAYDPRTFKGMGITFATSPMGADHTAGPAIAGRKARQDREYGDLWEAREKIDLSRDLQTYIAVLDSMGLCYFVGPSFENMAIVATLLNARFGWSMSQEAIAEWGKSLLRLERDFNTRAGHSPSEDQLPAFFREAIPETERVFDIAQDLLDQFWAE